jgi:hypothetical protein
MIGPGVNARLRRRDAVEIGGGDGLGGGLVRRDAGRQMPGWDRPKIGQGI